MITNYFIVDDFLLNEIQNLNNNCIYEKIEYLLDNDDIYPCCDIDNVANDLFSIISLKENEICDLYKENLRNNFIWGNNKNHYISYVKKENIKKIVDEIETININIEIKEKNNIIFKNLKDYKNGDLDKELYFEELEISFYELKDFYNLALNNNKNILIFNMEE